jgi:pyruvate/2-oxoglutarate dehydrogenase complex dihydrolipoamide acyltransferase (E2) component
VTDSAGGSSEVRFPDLGQGDASTEPGVVATWFVGDGEAVSEGQLLAEVQVGKVAAEVHAPRSGVLRRLEPEGVPLGPGALLGRVE